MATRKRRENGAGSIYKHGALWVGKYCDGLNEDGTKHYAYISAPLKADVRKKLQEIFEKQLEQGPGTLYTVETYVKRWLIIYKFPNLKQSSYDRLENTVLNQIIPEIGDVYLVKLTSDQIQGLLTSLRARGMSYSSVKKVYDCLGAVFKHAMLCEDVQKNPMLRVKLPDKRLFPQKEITIFTEKEIALFKEECLRMHSTGTPKYGSYGDALLLMLCTGIRLGEVLGLQKVDINFKAKTMHVRRNVQSVQKRNSKGERQRGRDIVYTTTKTYSGDRVLPLNENAISALRRLFSRHPESPYVVCQSDGTTPPPERLERTFYRILDNIHISRVGTHTLRHTFASILFSKGVDVKTVSSILGHASIQITLNTYIHLIEKVNHEAVRVMDEIL